MGLLCPQLHLPHHWEADVVLRDGRTCHIRPIRPTDGPALEEFHKGLSEETLYMRFFTASPELMARDIERLLHGLPRSRGVARTCWW